MLSGWRSFGGVRAALALASEFALALRSITNRSPLSSIPIEYAESLGVNWSVSADPIPDGNRHSSRVAAAKIPGSKFVLGGFLDSNHTEAQIRARTSAAMEIPLKH